LCKEKKFRRKPAEDHGGRAWSEGKKHLEVETLLEDTKIVRPQIQRGEGPDKGQSEKEVSQQKQSTEKEEKMKGRKVSGDSTRASSRRPLKPRK